MQEEQKSIGGALIDVFDAGVTLIKAEIKMVAQQVGDAAKAKGLGLVLLFGAIGPLLLGIVFLILSLYFGLVRLGLGWWSAALCISVFSFILMAVLVVIGLKKLSSALPDETKHKHKNLHPEPRKQVQATDSHVQSKAQNYVAGQSKQGNEVSYNTADQKEHEKHKSHSGHPVILADEAGIDVSTKPTFREDMKKEGY